MRVKEGEGGTRPSAYHKYSGKEAAWWTGW